jgi:diguanylate cyclase (GGDEF)-like protein/PAS domain S-box-containing protein
MSNITILLWVSVVIQCLAAVLALRLIPLSGRAWAWIILSVVFFLMATRRTLSLIYQEGGLQDSWLQAFSAEIVALIISSLTVVGVFMIRKIFVQQRADAEKVRTLSEAVEQNPGVTIITNTEGRIEYVNAAYCALTGRKSQEVINALPDILNPEIVDKETLGDIWTTIRSGNIWQGDVQSKYNDHHLPWETVRISPVLNHGKKITQYVILQEDVTQQREQHEQMEYMAMHDSLTDLPNRTLFNDRLKQAILLARRDKEPLAVMLMDLNNFKEINDSMGHQIGDEILKEIATRLLEIIRGGDTVARMGGDEFLILLPAAKSNKQIKFIERINSILETPFIVGKHSFEITASIGLSIFPEDGDGPEALLKCADVAMYAAKRSVESYKRYSKNLDADNYNRLELSHSLRTAVEEDQLVLHYQPIVNYSTATIDSVEVLVRWNHPDRGMLYPDSFIPLAEQTYHIGAITQWVIQHAFQQLVAWQKQGISIGVSVNISAYDLLDPELSIFIKSQLTAHKLAPSLVTIEITESALMMHTHQTLNNLHKLRNIGVKINIDDFGTGYSSLQYLKRFPVTGVKIDKSFVLNMTNDENDAIIVRSTADLAHNMGLTVVAEGIEDQDAYDILEILGCDYGQGYLMAKPMSADDLQVWLCKWRSKPHRTGIRAPEIKS